MRLRSYGDGLLSERFDVLGIFAKIVQGEGCDLQDLSTAPRWIIGPYTMDS